MLDEAYSSREDERMSLRRMTSDEFQQKSVSVNLNVDT